MKKCSKIQFFFIPSTNWGHFFIFWARQNLYRKESCIACFFGALLNFIPFLPKFLSIPVLQVDFYVSLSISSSLSLSPKVFLSLILIPLPHLSHSSLSLSLLCFSLFPHPPILLIDDILSFCSFSLSLFLSYTLPHPFHLVVLPFSHPSSSSSSSSISLSWRSLFLPFIFFLFCSSLSA